MNADEEPAVKLEASSPAKNALVMETLEVAQLLAQHVQTKRAAEKATSAPMIVPEVTTDVVIERGKLKAMKIVKSGEEDKLIQ